MLCNGCHEGCLPGGCSILCSPAVRRAACTVHVDLKVNADFGCSAGDRSQDVYTHETGHDYELEHGDSVDGNIQQQDHRQDKSLTSAFKCKMVKCTVVLEPLRLAGRPDYSLPSPYHAVDASNVRLEGDLRPPLRTGAVFHDGDGLVQQRQRLRWLFEEAFASSSIGERHAAFEPALQFEGVVMNVRRDESHLEATI